MKVKYYIKEMRVHHWIKNLLVFVPLICSCQLFAVNDFIATGYVFLSFCFLSSAIYFINDLRDVELDKQHKTKCKRPLAAGHISKKQAIACVIALLSVVILINTLSFNGCVVLALSIYFVLNLGYSFGLKNVILIDIAILASGFLIRIMAGAAATGIQCSSWLYLVVISAAFYFGLGKRRNELLRMADEARPVAKKYPFAFLDKALYLFMGMVFVFYALWAVDSNTVVLHGGTNLFWTFPVLILIFLKYTIDIEGDSDGDPVEVLIHDKALIGLCVLYLILMFVFLYILV